MELFTSLSLWRLAVLAVAGVGALGFTILLFVSSPTDQSPPRWVKWLIPMCVLVLWVTMMVLALIKDVQFTEKVETLNNSTYSQYLDCGDTFGVLLPQGSMKVETTLKDLKVCRTYADCLDVPEGESIVSLEEKDSVYVTLPKECNGPGFVNLIY